MTTNNIGGDKHALVITCHFKAPREKVFAAWTESEVLACWWGPCIFTAEA